MRISHFFIDRPIFAAVVSIVLVIVGAVSFFRLPIAQYPEIAPPVINVSGQYPGASAEVVAATVVAPIEEQINGVERMLYLSSNSTADGRFSISVTFDIGSDLDIAQVQVQNRVSIAMPRLPADVRNIGVTVNKASPDLMMIVHLSSPDRSRDILFVSNYATLEIKDVLARVDGVGSITVFGSRDYSMRIWLDPDRLQSMGMTASDVVLALQAQNLQVASGVLNQPPIPDQGAFQVAVQTLGRLANPEEFANIVVKQTPTAVVRLKDVGRVELGALDYSSNSYLDRHEAVALALFQRPGSNALATAKGVHEAMEQVSKRFPAGIKYDIVYNPTEFISQSVDAVVETILEAVVLVVLVVILFLQTWRAAVIPIVAIPVSLVGTFFFMAIFGFSLNNLSLIGLVLAIGIVVDDAIVVVENVERNIAAGLAPREATFRAMSEVSGPIVAIALVLVAVFVPLAFVSGLTGQFYRQFALTIAISTVISAFNSLTLSPALAALLLKPHGARPDRFARAIDFAFGWFFRGFNRVFGRASDGYRSGVARVLGHKTIAMGAYLALIAVAWVAFQAVPRGFVPAQDKQYLVGFAQLPDGATLDRTEQVIRAMSAIALKQPGVEAAVAFPGISLNGFTNSPNAGVVFVTLKPFDERRAPALSGFAVAGSLNRQFGAIQDAFTMVFPPPPVQGLGVIGGFKLQVEDRAALGYEALDGATKAFLGKAYQTPELAGLFTNYRINVPQLYADVDRVKARQLGVQMSDVFDTMQVYLGSLYVNDFTRFGRTYQVKLQADAPFRARAEDIGRLKTRNDRGEMVPLSSLLSVTPSFGPDRVMRYNGYTAADINGGPAPGFSSGQAQAAVERIARETLPKGIGVEWTELTYQEILAGNSAVIVFPLALLLVFLVLAALYESWTLPLAVILIAPMALLAAIAGVWLTRGDNNVFTQIALVVLMGLAAKNAILIVEFARDLERQGRTIVQAAIEASRLRLRPILMTSFAFIMGVLPLAFSVGAGAEMRRAIGIAVFGGMLGVTLFGLLLTPLFYVLLRTLAERFARKPAGGALPAAVHAAPRDE